MERLWTALAHQGRAQAAHDGDSSHPLGRVIAGPSEGIPADGESVGQPASWDDELLALELQKLSEADCGSAKDYFLADQAM